MSALELVRVRVGSQIERELTVVDRQLRHVVRLVDDLLDVSRIAHGRVRLQREAVDLADVIGRAVERSRPLMDERHHELVVGADPGLVVCGDLERLTQVVGNLLANAGKYTHLNGRIEVSAHRVGDRIVVRVRDDGVGIAPEMLSRVFDLFVQDPRSLDRSKGGLGLGLAIVRTLVAAHDGTVTAASDGPGKGSTLTIELPALPVTEAATAEISALTVGSQPVRVLIVDDNVDAAEILAETLGLLGYETHRTYDAESALTLASSVRPSIALLDIGLPIIDGYALAIGLRRIEALEDILLIAVTGYGRASDRDRSRVAASTRTSSSQSPSRPYPGSSRTCVSAGVFSRRSPRQQLACNEADVRARAASSVAASTRTGSERGASPRREAAPWCPRRSAR